MTGKQKVIIAVSVGLAIAIGVGIYLHIKKKSEGDGGSEGNTADNPIDYKNLKDSSTIKTTKPGQTLAGGGKG